MSQAAYSIVNNDQQQPQRQYFQDVSQAAQTQESQLPNRHQRERRPSTEVPLVAPGAPRLIRSRAIRQGNLPPRRLVFDDEIIPPVRSVLFPGF
jgi:hypothetical protein